MESRTRDLDTILESFPARPDQLISILQEVQSTFNYISPEAMSLVCDHVGVRPARAWSVATFYKAFSLEPRGEHEIHVCMGTACHVKNAENVYERFRRELRLDTEEGTTKDQHFTLSKVRCLGCCSMAPVAQIDADVHGYLDQRQAARLVRAYRPKEPDNGPFGGGHNP